MPKCGRRTELPPFESQVGGIFNEELVNRNAPFGTKFTPVLRTKIIGGKAYTIQESQRKSISQQRQVSMHDDAVQTDFTTPTSRSQQQVLSLNKNSADGSGKYWNNHNILPPISGGIESYPTQTTRNTYTHPQSQLVSTTQPTTYSNITSNKGPTIEKPISNMPTESNSNKPEQMSPHGQAGSNAWKPAAGYSYLPAQPISLSKDQEIFLVNKLVDDIASCQLEQVRDVYQDLASSDHQLSGWLDYSEVVLVLQKHGIYPNMNTLRLLASTCVSTTQLGVIDYEKLLSYLITAIKKGKDRQAAASPTYFTTSEQPAANAPTSTGVFQSQSDDRPPSPDSALSDGELLRLVQQQLLLSDSNRLNLERLRREFEQADRSHRLTLSHTQIRDICSKMKVPIHPFVVNQMLAHCQTNGDGQYVWGDFIEILERVLPHATGLLIPESKRPTEYARKYLKPNESWPHPDPSFAPNKVPAIPAIPVNQMQPDLAVKPSPRQAEQMNYVSPRTLQHQHISAPAILETRSKPVQPQPQLDNTAPKPYSKEESDNWFLGIKKLAGALYRNDLNRKGSMKPEQCRWLITEYNDIYDLNLQPEIVDSCIYQSTTASGTDIDGLLRLLLMSRST